MTFLILEKMCVLVEKGLKFYGLITEITNNKLW